MRTESSFRTKKREITELEKNSQPQFFFHQGDGQPRKLTKTTVAKTTAWTKEDHQVYYKKMAAECIMNKYALDIPLSYALVERDAK